MNKISIFFLLFFVQPASQLVTLQAEQPRKPIAEQTLEPGGSQEDSSKASPIAMTTPWYEGFQLYAGFLLSFPLNIDLAKLADISKSDLDNNTLRIAPGPGFELGLSYYLFGLLGIGFDYKYARMISPDLFLNNHTIHSASVHIRWRFYLGKDPETALFALEPYLNLGYTYNILKDLRITIISLATAEGKTETRGTFNTGVGLRASARFLPFLSLYLDISANLLIVAPAPMPLFFLSAGLSFQPRFRRKVSKTAASETQSSRTRIIYVRGSYYILYFEEDSENMLQVSQVELQKLISDLDNFVEIESILIQGYAAPLGELEGCEDRDCSDSEWYDLPKRRMDRVRDALADHGIDVNRINYRFDEDNGIHIAGPDVPRPQYRYYRNVKITVTGRKREVKR